MLIAKDCITLIIEIISLFIEHIIIIKKVFPDFKVAILYTLLGFLDCITQHTVFNGLPILHANLAEHGLQVFRGEQSHQGIIQGDKEPACTRVTLTATSTTQLIIDTSGFMSFSAKDIEPAELLYLFIIMLPCRIYFLDCFSKLLSSSISPTDGSCSPVKAATKLDIGSTSCHVCGNGNRTFGTSVLDDQGLSCMVLGIEHLVLDAHPAKQDREQLAFLNADGTDKDWLTGTMDLLNLLTDGLELELFIIVDQIRKIFSNDRLVGRDNHNIEAVDLEELRSFGICGTGHTADFIVHPEEVLVCDCGESLVLSKDLDFFLCLNCLMETLAVAPAVEYTAGEFINNLYLSFDDHIVYIGGIETKCLYCLGDVVDILEVLILIE